MSKKNLEKIGYKPPEYPSQVLAHTGEIQMKKYEIPKDDEDTIAKFAQDAQRIREEFIEQPRKPTDLSNAGLCF